MDHQTIGVAIRIPDPWHAELTAARTALGDPAADRVPPHITLVPPTQLPAAADINSHLVAAAAAHQPFSLMLRGTGTFRPVTNVVFVAVVAGISHCELLQDDLRTGPLVRELQFPYHPHVTIAHDVAPPLLDTAFSKYADFTAEFTVDSFTLYRHGDDGRWRPARDFPLGN